MSEIRQYKSQIAIEVLCAKKERYRDNRVFREENRNIIKDLFFIIIINRFKEYQRDKIS